MNARVVSYQHVVSGQMMHVKSIVAGRGHKMWVVYVISLGDTAPDFALRILNSIAITP
jgi:hypothetical protein